MAVGHATPDPVGPETQSPLGAALDPDALRDALHVRRPVFDNPWDSPPDMFACLVAVSILDPLLLWAGGKAMGAIFGFSSHWHIGVFIAAALVGAAGFMTITGRARTSLAVDVLAIGAWLLLGFVVAPVLGLAPPAAVSVACYAVMMAGIFGYVLFYGRWRTAFLRTLSWPIIWSLLAALFAYCSYHMILFQ